MEFSKNQFGIPQYPLHDARRLFVLLAAIELLERPTAAALADLTGHAREHIEADTLRLREEYGVDLAHVGEVYRILSWGPVLKPEGVRQALHPELR